jgi:hypothetical protein
MTAHGAITVDAQGVSRNAKGKRVCGRQKTRGRGPCESTFLYANGACKKHGGPSLSGAAHPSFIHGKFIKGLPRHLREHYIEARTDKQLLVMRDHIALLDARIEELLGRLDTGESVNRWKAAAAAMAEFKNWQKVGDKQGMVAALTTLDAVLTAGATESEGWADVYRAMDQRRKVTAVEIKRELAKHRVLTEDRAYEMLRLVLHTLRTRISDRKLLGLIGGDLERMLGGSVVDVQAVPA